MQCLAMTTIAIYWAKGLGFNFSCTNSLKIGKAAEIGIGGNYCRCIR